MNVFVELHYVPVAEMIFLKTCTSGNFYSATEVSHNRRASLNNIPWLAPLLGMIFLPLMYFFFLWKSEGTPQADMKFHDDYLAFTRMLRSFIVTLIYLL